jgi:hypothetical protein
MLFLPDFRLFLFFVIVQMAVYQIIICLQSCAGMLNPNRSLEPLVCFLMTVIRKHTNGSNDRFGMNIYRI